VNGDLFVTGTDTGVGKTLLSALLVSALKRKYWKPIQTGASEGTDRDTVVKWAGIDLHQTYPERYIFAPPLSPHLAAGQHNVEINLDEIHRPASLDRLIIEGAGGVLVPLNNNAFMLDLMRQIGAPVLVAARTALGTINHTLLTLAALRNAKLDVRGVVMIGKENRDNQLAVELYGGVPVVGWIPWLEQINRETLVAVFQQFFDSQALA
jgi:dethiobiotin synthetase